MKSKVYFVPVKDSRDTAAMQGALAKLLKESGVLGCLEKGDRVAVKIHFGEEGNTGYIEPIYAAAICRAIIAKKAAAYLSDSNALYRGRRLLAADHLKLAGEHGFTKEATGAEILIPDDTQKENIIEVKINKKHIKVAKIPRFFIDSDAILAVSHFKGHMLTGFGGAIKNVGMGCATRQGKLAQHCDVSPVIYAEKCIGCGACVEVCPVEAIHIVNKKSVLDRSKCIGCASCVGACPTYAMFIELENGGDVVQEKMAEYSLAVLMGKERKSGFINFAVKINKECDCWGGENSRIAPDIGILASLDPVAIDMACFDLVKQAAGKDIFKEAHPAQDGMVQLRHAEKLDVGSTDYELIGLGA